MRKRRNLVTAIVLAFIIAVAPVAVFAAEPIYLTNVRMIELTPEAAEIVLEDLAYLEEMIMAIAPTQNIAAWLLGMTLEDYFGLLREAVTTGFPLPSVLAHLEPTRWAAAPTDPLSLAADYMFTIMTMIANDLGGLGHLHPQFGSTVEQVFLVIARNMYDYGEACQEDWPFQWRANFNFERLHYQIYNTPSVLWFYDIDPSAFDFDFDPGDVLGHRNENNITALSLEPGYIAYIRIASFGNNVRLDSETLFPFYEQIQDYAHLIIDLRSNSGGWAMYFPTNVVSMLIDEPISFTYYEFFISNDITDEFFAYPVSMAGGTFQGVYPIAEFLESRDLPFFHQDDVALLDYVVVWYAGVQPAEDNIPFGGEIWLLVDGGSMSASEMAAKMSIATGFATVVGEPTAGITGVMYTFAAMPNTGILFRIDMGYTIDSYGRSIEEFGVMPQIATHGRDALDITLGLIAGYTLEELFAARVAAFDGVPLLMVDGEAYIAIRFAAYAYGFDVEWNGANHEVIVFDANGNWFTVPVEGDVFMYSNRVFIPLQSAIRMFSDTMYIPLIGTWVWEGYEGYRYIFNSDGTGNRGIPGVDIAEFIWEVHGYELHINLLGYVPAGIIRYERWAFYYDDYVLILDSLQAFDFWFMYFRA